MRASRSVPEASYPVVLVRCDRREAGFLENEGFVVLLGVFLAVLAGVHVDHVEPGLVAVHGVQNDLWNQGSHSRRFELFRTWSDYFRSHGFIIIK